jgi:hypothetical protein
MSAPRITPSIPALPRRRIRTATALAATAVLIATGGYAATTTIAPDAHQSQNAPTTHDTGTATDQVMRELRESIARQYGSQPAAPTSVPSDHAMREYRTTVTKLYGPQQPPADTGQ